MITLKEHNIKPYEELCRMLETQDKVAYVSATGTGKSYVIGKYIDSHGLEGETVILVPSNAIRRSWKKLMPNVTVNTYQGLLKGTIDLTRFSLIICDEMHHLGANLWGPIFQAGVKDFTGKMIGISATPIRYLDEQRDIVEEYFEGNRVDGLDLAKAISNGILPSFDYIAALYSIPKKKNKNKSTNAVTDSLFTQLDFMASRYSFQEILKKHMDETNRKTAVFVGYVKDIDEIKALCKQIFPDAEHIEAYATMGTAAVRERIAQFENCNKRAFFYSVNLLNEGVHIDGVDSIIMFRKTISPAIYLQQLGRALSADNKQKRVKIFDFVANHGNMKTYQNSNSGVLGCISSGIDNPERQIIISDYAMEEYELLDRIDNALSMRWTEEEDAILRKYYGQKNGGQKVTEMLAPKRTKWAVRSRANQLGLARKYTDYPKEMVEDILEIYPRENGTKLLQQKYPDLTLDELSRIANKNGVKRREAPMRWSEEEDAVLLANEGLTAKELVELLPGRSSSAIQLRKSKLGLRYIKQWTKEEDQILIDNIGMTSKEIQEKFFPDVKEKHICYRRYGILKLPKTTVEWTHENIELFKTLFSEGGTQRVLKHPMFKWLSADSVRTKATEFNAKSPYRSKNFTAEELMLIADFIGDSKGETIKDFSKKLNCRTPATVAYFIREIKSGNVDLEKKIEKAKAREAKEAQNA